MTLPRLHLFGNVPVPYTASWSAEDRSFIGICPYARHRAICQDIAPGVGRPRFGKPHSQRQREVILNGLCDLCAKSLKNRTKVSLSHARVNARGADGPCIMQVEPLLHRECAAISLRHCPSLKRDIAGGGLRVRQVTRHRRQLAIMGPQFIPEYVPDYQPRATDKIIGHAKVELCAWTDRDLRWLEQTPSPTDFEFNPPGVSGQPGERS